MRHAVVDTGRGGPQASLAELAPHRDRLRVALDGRSVALTQEWVASRAGSEKVFEALAHLLPDADLFSLSVTPGVSVSTGGRPIAVSWLDRKRLRDSRALTLPLMPVAWRTMTRNRYDVAITSAHALGRTFVPSQTLHFSYVHSPARYLWFPEVDTRSGRWRRPFETPMRTMLKRVDLTSTRACDELAANSLTTQRRIQQVYGRSTPVINPPVDVQFFEPAGDRADSFVLAVSRFVPYKRLDLAVEVAADVGVRLVIAGDGPDRGRLEEIAAARRADVEFVRSPSDQELRRLYRTASALLFFSNEDFGMIPVEAQACGCPVVTAGVGGALETVVDGVTGRHAAGPDAAAATGALRSLLDDRPTPEACRTQALRFSYDAFGAAVVDWMTTHLGESGAELRS